MAASVSRQPPFLCGDLRELERPSQGSLVRRVARDAEPVRRVSAEDIVESSGVDGSVVPCNGVCPPTALPHVMVLSRRWRPRTRAVRPLRPAALPSGTHLLHEGAGTNSSMRLMTSSSTGSGGRRRKTPPCEATRAALRPCRSLGCSCSPRTTQAYGPLTRSRWPPATQRYPRPRGGRKVPSC